MRCDSTMQHQARQKLELMVLHEYTPPKCFPNTSLTIRLSRPLIRKFTRSRVQGIPLPAVMTLNERAYHCIRCRLSRHCKTVHTTASETSCRDTPPTPQPELSCPLYSVHGSWHVSTRSPWDSTSATRSRRHRYRTISIQHLSKGRSKLC